MEIKSKLSAKNIIFKNRIIMPPMATAKADKNGHITLEHLDYYKEKTSSKLFAAVIVEHSYVEKRGKAHDNQTSIAEDSDMEGMAKLAEVIKLNEALAVLQLAHAGSAAKKDVTGEIPPAPSAIINPARGGGELPRELSLKEIEEIKNSFIKAAIRAKKAGFDAVEIHSAHGYLLNQFLSPLTNKRKDEYGGDVKKRIRLHIEILKGIKERLGKDYPVFIRIGAGDFMDGGLSQEDSVIAAKELEKAGVDIIDISGGMCRYSICDTNPGYFAPLSKPIFDTVKIPVILTGGVQKGEDVADILDREVCDLVGVGRAVLKNSLWMEEEIRKFLL